MALSAPSTSTLSCEIRTKYSLWCGLLASPKTDYRWLGYLYLRISNVCMYLTPLFQKWFQFGYLISSHKNIWDCCRLSSSDSHPGYGGIWYRSHIQLKFACARKSSFKREGCRRPAQRCPMCSSLRAHFLKVRDLFSSTFFGRICFWISLVLYKRSLASLWFSLLVSVSEAYCWCTFQNPSYRFVKDMSLLKLPDYRSYGKIVSEVYSHPLICILLPEV